MPTSDDKKHYTYNKGPVSRRSQQTRGNALRRVPSKDIPAKMKRGQW